MADDDVGTAGLAKTQPHDADETATASAPAAASRCMARRSSAHGRYSRAVRGRAVRSIPGTPCAHWRHIDAKGVDVRGYAAGPGSDHTNLATSSSVRARRRARAWPYHAWCRTGEALVPGSPCPRRSDVAPTPRDRRGESSHPEPVHRREADAAWRYVPAGGRPATPRSRLRQGRDAVSLG